MKFILFLFASTLALWANPFEDLMGKSKAFLDSRGFYCHSTSCIAQEQNYFDSPLLDETVDYIETFSNHEDKVYKIAIHLFHNKKLKDEEIDKAFYQALVDGNRTHQNIVYAFLTQSDKYGNKKLIVLTDTQLEKQYIDTLKAEFTKALSGYKHK